MDVFRAEEWGEEQVELARWLGLRYIVVDHTKAGSPVPVAPGGFEAPFEQGGFEVQTTPFPNLEITLLELDDPRPPEHIAPATSVSIDYSHSVFPGSESPEVYLWLRNRSGPQFIPPRGESWMFGFVGTTRKGRSSRLTRSWRTSHHSGFRARSSESRYLMPELKLGPSNDFGCA